MRASRLREHDPTSTLSEPPEERKQEKKNNQLRRPIVSFNRSHGNLVMTTRGQRRENFSKLSHQIGVGTFLQ